MTKTTPTGVPIMLCMRCHTEHAVSLQHCKECRIPTRFINPEGLCLICAGQSKTSEKLKEQK